MARARMVSTARASSSDDQPVPDLLLDSPERVASFVVATGSILSSLSAGLTVWGGARTSVSVAARPTPCLRRFTYGSDESTSCGALSEPRPPSLGRLGAAVPGVACQGPVPLSRVGRFGAANPPQPGAAATELTPVGTGSARRGAARRPVARLDSDSA